MRRRLSGVYLYDKDLTLLGESSADTTIFSSTGPAVEVVDHALSLSGFTLRGFGADTTEGGALHAEDAQIHATDLIVSDGSTPTRAPIGRRRHL